MKKHAYLILVHNNFYTFEVLLKLLDYELNDLYIHVDKKVADFDYDYYKKIVKKSNIYFVDRISVSWGTYSIAEAIYILLKNATNNFNYHYYHVISGVDLPLKTEKEIHSFFENKDTVYTRYSDRFQLIKVKNLSKKGFISRNEITLRRGFDLLISPLKKLFKIKPLRNCDLVIKKGPNWFSVPDKCARYIISQENKMKNLFENVLSSDEYVFTTTIYNSDFQLKFSGEEEHLRLVDWTRGKPYVFRREDYDLLLNSNKFFARKFNENIDSEIIDMIYKYLTK